MKFELTKTIRACRLCAGELPLGPRPIIWGNPGAKILIIGQAPGMRVHESGVPWDDKSGERLRDWLSLGANTFYDEDKIAIMPMGFCYPGRAPNGADLPPRTECAPQWHDQILSEMPLVELTLLAGSFTQNYYLGKRAAKTMTGTIRVWKNFGPGIVQYHILAGVWRSGSRETFGLRMIYYLI